MNFHNCNRLQLSHTKIIHKSAYSENWIECLENLMIESETKENFELNDEAKIFPFDNGEKRIRGHVYAITSKPPSDMTFNGKKIKFEELDNELDCDKYIIGAYIQWLKVCQNKLWKSNDKYHVFSPLIKILYEINGIVVKLEDKLCFIKKK